MNSDSGLKYATAAHSQIERPRTPARYSSQQAPSHTCVNVSESERQASMIGGTVLAVCGLLRGSVSGLAMAALGGALIWRGHTGHCEAYHAMGYSTAENSGKSCKT